MPSSAACRSSRDAEFSASGKIITFLLVMGLLVLGAWLVMRGNGKDEAASGAATPTASANADGDAATASSGDAPEPIEPLTSTPQLDHAATYTSSSSPS